MPSTVAESDIFAASFQRPNNGELADAASLLQFLQVLGNSRRYLYNRSLPGNIDATRFGVVGSGAVDDATAINNAIAAAKTLGAGTVLLPGGKSYRCDSALSTLDGRVALKIMKGTNGSNPSRLIRNFAGSLITVNNTFGVDTETPTVIEGFKFDDLNGAANPLIDVQDGSLTLQHCLADGYAAAGPFVEFAGGQSCWLRLLGCTLKPDNGQSAVHHRIGQMLALGCTFRVLSTTYNSSFMVDVDSSSAADPAIAHLVGNYFDATDQSLGTGGAVLGRGSYWDINAVGNTFQTEFQTFTAFTWASSFATARRLVEYGNTFHLATPYAGAGDPLSGTSQLALQPEYWHSGAGNWTVPDGYASAFLQFTTTVPAITLPAMLFVGQELDLIVHNGSGGNTWSPVINGVDSANLSASIGPSLARSWRFRVYAPTGSTTFKWVCVSGPSVAFTP